MWYNIAMNVNFYTNEYTLKAVAGTVLPLGGGDPLRAWLLGRFNLVYHCINRISMSFVKYIRNPEPVSGLRYVYLDY